MPSVPGKVDKAPISPRCLQNHRIPTARVKFIITEPHMLATVLTAARERNIFESRLFVFDAVDDVDYGSHRSEDILLQHSESDRMM